MSLSFNEFSPYCLKNSNLSGNTLKYKTVYSNCVSLNNKVNQDMTKEKYFEGEIMEEFKDDEPGF